MLDSKSVIELIGYLFIVLGIIATAHTLMERLFRYSLFDTFIKVAPVLLRGFVPHEPFYVWLENRTINRNIYQTWDVVLFYLLTLSAVFSLMAGFWIILILRILSILYIPVYILVLWFVFLFITYSVSASNQAAINMKIIYPKLNNTEQIKREMYRKPFLTLKLYFKYLFGNWIFGPYNTLKVFLLILLILLFYWPAWLIYAFQRDNKIDLTDDKTRTTYFIGYALVFILLGTSLNFFIA